MIKVLFNTNAIRSRNTGIGKYTLALRDSLQKVAADQVTIMSDGAIENINSHQETSKNSTLMGLVRDHVPFAYTARRFLEQRQFDKLVNGSDPDLYHEPTLWPLSFSGPTVITVHDLSHLRFPETQPKNRLKEINKRFDNAMDQAASILVDSHFIQQELLSHYPSIANKLKVAPLGCSQSLHQPNQRLLAALLSQYQLVENSYFIFVGTLEPRKRLPLAIASHQALPKAMRKLFPLLVIGDKGWLNHDQHAELDEFIVLTGYLGDNELSQLMQGARAMLFTSIYEGFGLPVLESMVAGTPCILSPDIASAEIASETALYASGSDPDEWVKALKHAIEAPDIIAKLAEQAKNRAKEYTWERCAELRLNAYQDAIS